MTVSCPKCDADITETYEPDDPSVGITGGWYCDTCDLGVAEWEIEREPSEDDVPISFARKRDPGEKVGTPLSELSGRPGHKGYAEFCQIACSWGYD